MRIFEAAKKYDVKSDRVIGILEEAGFVIKSHMTAMTDDMVAAVEKRLKKPAEKAPDKKVEPRTVSRPVGRTVTRKAAAPKAKAAPKGEPARAEAPPAKIEKTAPKLDKAVPKVDKAAPKVDKAAPKVEKTHTPAPSRPVPKPPLNLKARGAEPAPKPAQRTEFPERKAPSTPAARPARPTGPEAARAKPAAPAAPKGVPPKQPPSPPAKKAAPAARAEAVSAAEEKRRAVRESVRRTLARIEVGRRTKRRKGKSADVEVEEHPVRLAEGLTVRQVAEAFKADAEEVLKRCVDLGVATSLSQTLNKDAVEILAEDLGKRVHFVADEVEDLLKDTAKIEPSRLKPRAPIVTVMGHVDHGKTSILDYIRKSRVAAGEPGGITQHIGAYEVTTPHGRIAFVDTPGHEAFTAMRARGAKVTDLVVLVVGADDGVMPQTIEAINHAKAAQVPIVVAINKTDLPTANPKMVKQQLAERGVVVEDFGGDVVSAEVSAKTGEGIDRLLEMISLQAELMELVADPGAAGQGVAIEVEKEEGRGILCTVLVMQGTLRVGDTFVIGSTYGKARALLDYRGRPIKEAGPATPVLVLGANDLPEAGDKLTVVPSEREAREISMRRAQSQKDRDKKAVKKLTLEELYTQIQQGDVKELRLIVKGDANGSIEALTASLGKLAIEEVVVKVIHSGVGVVNESDVLLAESSSAIIIAFSVKVSPKAIELAERRAVDVRSYEIIYDVISDVEQALKGMLEPERVERVIGRAEVRKVFKISKLGQIAGSYVTEGSITRNASVRVIRGGAVLFEGKISSLKRFQDDAREVLKDFECGIGVAGFNDLQEGDVLEAFVVEEKARVS